MNHQTRMYWNVYLQKKTIEEKILSSIVSFVTEMTICARLHYVYSISFYQITKIDQVFQCSHFVSIKINLL